MTFRIGGKFDRTTAIGPANTGLNLIAQTRLDNTIARANAKQQNSLSVDAILFYVWRRNWGGLPCTCVGHKRSSNSVDTLPSFSDDVNANRRQFQPAENTMYSPESGELTSFQIETNNFDSVALDIQEDPEKALDFAESLDDAENDLGADALLEHLSQPVDEEKLARLVAGISSGAVYGGDKTKCGICYATGYREGYTLYNGQRFILDFSGVQPFQLNNADINYESRPYLATLSSGNSSIVWTVDLPPYFNQWVDFRVSNNLKDARGVIFEIYLNGTWTEITLAILESLKGTDNVNTQVRVRRNPDLPLDADVVLTHAELTCMYGVPLIGQMPQLPITLTYETLQPIISTTIEMSPKVGNLSRESIIQDSKTDLLWKVNEVTGNQTSINQVYGYNLSVRRLMQGEVKTRLKMPRIMATM